MLELEGEVMAAEEIGVADEVLEAAGAEEADVDSSVLVLESEGVAEADVVD
jgi:stress response protein SCP2